jgi:hypothetical protein
VVASLARVIGHAGLLPAANANLNQEYLEARSRISVGLTNVYRTHLPSDIKPNSAAPRAIIRIIQGQLFSKASNLLMESSLHEVWEGAAGNPFVPTIGKDSQFWVGILLLILGTLLTGFFGLSECS